MGGRGARLSAKARAYYKDREMEMPYQSQEANQFYADFWREGGYMDSKMQPQWRKNSIEANTDKYLIFDKNYYQKYQRGVANKDNFYGNSIANFEDIGARPTRQPDYVSHDRAGKVSSEYWYTDDGVIRGSDHWGESIGSSSWFINHDSSEGKKRYGKANWTEFTMKTSIYETKGKDYLTNWNNVKGWIKTGYGNVRAITEDTFKNAR